MSLDAPALQRLSALLDQALDLPEPAREAWLTALQGEAAAHAPLLRKLLAQHAGPVTGDVLAGPAFLPPAEPPAFAAGDAVGPYRLLRPIGEGGMGEVWLAERADGHLKRPVALKLPMLGLRRNVLVQRFERERDIVGALVHPHIARLYDAGLADDGQPYLAFEHVDGRPIDEAARALDLRARVGLMLQVMDAVQYAHANLVIHRDLKPRNVLVTTQGQAKLLDFGIAKLLQAEQGEAHETELTRLGGRALTLAYAAPEQLSAAPISIATDIWALGVLLHELLAGARPFTGERQELERAILERDPPRPGGVPKDLAAIVSKALQKVPAARYATVAAFAEDLQRWLGGLPVQARPEGRWYRARKFAERHRLPLAAGAVTLAAFGLALGAGATALVVGALLLGLGATLWQASKARAQARIAQAEADRARVEARTAAAVQEFLQGIFMASTGAQPDPAKARQRTALELLDEGAARIEHALEDAPQSKLSVLMTLASIFDDLGETERMVHMLERRAELGDRVLPRASGERAIAHAEMAGALAVVGRDADAWRHLQQAQDAVASLPADEPAHGEVERGIAQYHAARGGDAQGLDAARRLAERMRGRPPGLDVTNALMLLGKLERLAGLAQPAVQTLQRAVQVARALPGGGESTLHVLLVELALAEADAGLAGAALEHVREAVRVVESNAGPNAPSTIITLARCGQLLTEQARALEALEPLLLARSRIEGDASLSALGAIVGPQRFHEAQARRRLGQLGPALECYCHSLDACSGPDGALRAMLGSVPAMVALGRAGEAEQVLARARALRDEAGLAGYGHLLLLAQAEMACVLASGDGARAQALWHAFFADERVAPHRTNPSVLALQAQAALAAGNLHEASRLAQQALARLQAGPPLPNAAYEQIELERVLKQSAAASDSPTPAAGPANRSNGHLGPLSEPLIPPPP